MKIKTFALVVLLFSVANLIRHYGFYVYILGLSDILPFEFEIYFIPEIIWFVPSLLGIGIAIKLLMNNGGISFYEFRRSYTFYFLLGFMFIAILLEVPIWGKHPDAAGVRHSNSFWSAWTH